MNQSQSVWKNDHKISQIFPLKIAIPLDDDVSMDSESSTLNIPIKTDRSRSQSTKNQQQTTQQKPPKPRQIKTNSLALSRSFPLSSPPTPRFYSPSTPSLTPSSSSGEFLFLPSPAFSNRSLSTNFSDLHSQSPDREESMSSSSPSSVSVSIGSPSPKRKKLPLLPGVYTLPFDQYPTTHPGPPILSSENEAVATKRVGLVLAPSLRHRFYVWELFSSPARWASVPLYFADEDFLTLYAAEFAEIGGQMMTIDKLRIGEVFVEAGRRCRGLVTFSITCDFPGLKQVTAARKLSNSDEAVVVKRVSHFRAEVLIEYVPIVTDPSVSTQPVQLRSPFYWIRAKWHDYIGTKPFSALHLSGPVLHSDYVPSQLDPNVCAVYDMEEFRRLRASQPGSGKRRKRKSPRSASYSDFSSMTLKVPSADSPSSMSIGSPSSAPLFSHMYGTPSSASPNYNPEPPTPLRLDEVGESSSNVHLLTHNRVAEQTVNEINIATNRASSEPESRAVFGRCFSESFSVRSNSPSIPAALPIPICPPPSFRSLIAPRASYVSWDGNVTLQGSHIELLMANHWPTYADAPESEMKEQMRARFSAEIVLSSTAMLTPSFIGRRMSIPLEIYFGSNLDSRMMQIRLTRRTLLGYLGSEYSFFQSALYPNSVQLSLEFLFQFNTDPSHFIGAVPVTVTVYLPFASSSDPSQPRTHLPISNSLYIAPTLPLPPTTEFNEQIADGISNAHDFLLAFDPASQ